MSDCPICLEAFNCAEHTPVLLFGVPPCGHSCCMVCVQKLAAKDARVICPVCRSEVAVPDGGVGAMPKNFSLMGVIEERMQHQQQVGSSEHHEMLCEICADKHVASSRCLECEENMCASVVRIHTRTKLTAGHHVVAVEEAKSQNGGVASLVCAEHRSAYRYYDTKCGKLICQDCAMLEHQGHKSETVARAGAHARGELSELSQRAVRRVSELRGAEQAVAGALGELQVAEQRVEAEVRSSFQQLREAVAARERAVLDSMHHFFKAKQFELATQRDLLATYRACLESASQRVASVGQSSDVAVLLARADLSSTLGALVSQVVALEPQSHVTLSFSADTSAAQAVGMHGSVFDSSTYASACKAQGAGLQQALSGQPGSFIVRARDEQGRERKQGGDVFAVTCADDEKLAAQVQDRGDGSYLVEYTLASCGSHKLAVSLRGVQIEGSPFAVEVRDGRQVGFVRKWGSSGSADGQFSKPSGIAVSAQGEVYVADYSNHRVQVFRADGTFVRKWGSSGSADGQLSYPSGIAVSAQGEVYVADNGNQRVQVFGQ